jgi:hypothetical protein
VNRDVPDLVPVDDVTGGGGLIAADCRVMARFRDATLRLVRLAAWQQDDAAGSAA